MYSMKKIFIFDVDGTLFNTREGIVNAFNKVLVEFKKEKLTQNQESRIIGPSVRDSFINMFNFSNEDSELATKLYRKYYVEEFIVQSKLYDGVMETLFGLKRKKCKLCIATMKTETQIQKLLKINNLKDLFDIVKAAKDDGSYKKAQMILDIKGDFGSDYKYYMVGDTNGDYEAAKKAEVEFIGVTYGFGFDDEYHSFLTVERLNDLVKYVENL